jgi:hypothetical protein
VLDESVDGSVDEYVDESVDEAARRRDEDEFLDAFWRTSNGETGDAETDERGSWCTFL